MQFFVVQTDVSVLQLFFYVFNWLFCYTFFIYSHCLITQITPQLSKFFSGIFLYLFPHSVKCHLCSQLLFSASILFCYLSIYVNSVLCHSFALSVSDFCHKPNHFFHFHEHCFLLFFLFPWLLFLPSLSIACRNCIIWLISILLFYLSLNKYQQTHLWYLSR